MYHNLECLLCLQAIEFDGDKLLAPVNMSQGELKRMLDRYRPMAQSLKAIQEQLDINELMAVRFDSDAEGYGKGQSCKIFV